METLQADSTAGKRAAITVAAVTVSFGNFVAVNNLSLTLYYGQIRAIIGPNGAGKTTLLDAITGNNSPKSGRILLDDRQNLLKMHEAQIARAGVGRKFQKASVFDELLVEQNLELAVRRKRSRFVRELLVREKHEIREKIEELLKVVHLGDQRREKAGSLSHGQKQWLEIGMLLALESKVLLLDEPVAGMTDDETDRTAALVKSLNTPERAIVVIEHDMNFVQNVADMVTVLHEGALLLEGPMEVIKNDPRVIEIYLGR